MSLNPMKVRNNTDAAEAVRLANIIQRKLWHCHNKQIGIKKGSPEEKIYMVMKDWIANLQSGMLRICVATELGAEPNKYLQDVLTQDAGNANVADAILIDAELESQARITDVSAFITHTIQTSKNPKILQPKGEALVMFTMSSQIARMLIDNLEHQTCAQQIPFLLVHGEISEVRLSNIYPAFEVKAHSPAVVAITLLCVGHSISQLISLVEPINRQVADTFIESIKSAFLLKN